MFFISITYLTLYKHILKYLHFIYNYNKKPHKETFKIKLYEMFISYKLIPKLQEIHNLHQYLIELIYYILGNYFEHLYN